MSKHGVWPILQSSSRQCTLAEFRGARVAVDAHDWLYKGALTCALELGRGEATKEYISHFLCFVRLLLMNRIKPLLVFKGRSVALRSRKELRLRKLNKEQADILYENGNVEEARRAYSKCIEVTHTMIFEAIGTCRSLQIDYIMAPNDSASQLAFFNRIGYVKCVISENPDALLFGCERVLYELNNNGVGRLMEATDIKQFWHNFDYERFLYTSLLAGCAYIDTIFKQPKTAIDFINTLAVIDRKKFLDQLAAYCGVPHMPTDYKSNFYLAKEACLHQFVYDPFLRALKRMVSSICIGEYHSSIIDELFGPPLSESLGEQLALGNVNPHTMSIIASWKPNTYNNESVWFDRAAMCRAKKHAKLLGVSQTANAPPDELPTNTLQDRKKLESSLRIDDVVNLISSSDTDDDNGDEESKSQNDEARETFSEVSSKSSDDDANVTSSSLPVGKTPKRKRKTKRRRRIFTSKHPKQ